MRQYRGLTKDGKWVYGWYVKARTCSVIIQQNCPVHAFFSEGIIVVPETVGQSTGLKDKNGKGKECYKGDLLGSRFFSAVLVVDQITEGVNCGQWIAKQKDGGIQDLYEALTVDGYEIIGNVHQDKELFGRAK